MDIKDQVSKLHQKIKKLGYKEFKRTHVQEVLATALGYNNFHVLKAKNEVKNNQKNINGVKQFIMKTDSSTGDDFKRIESVLVTIPSSVIIKIHTILGTEKFDKYDQVVFKTNNIKLEYIEPSNDLMDELFNSSMIGLNTLNQISILNGDGDDQIHYSIGHKINPDAEIQVILDKDDNHKFLFTHTYKYEQVFYELFFDISVLNEAPLLLVDLNVLNDNIG